MSTATGAALLFLASVFLHVAERWRNVMPSRAFVVVPVCAAFAIFRAHEDGPGPYFLVMGGLTAFGTGVALMSAVWPRVVWALAGLAAATVVAGIW